MQKNKYLDDLGLKIEEYGTNFCDDEDDKRQKEWAEERETYGFDARECWNLDRTYIEWLYSHLMKYIEDAQELIDLDYHKFTFNGKEYTQKEAIDYILDNLKEVLLTDNYYIARPHEQIKNAILMWAEICTVCWW